MNASKDPARLLNNWALYQKFEETLNAALTIQQARDLGLKPVTKQLGTRFTYNMTYVLDILRDFDPARKSVLVVTRDRSFMEVWAKPVPTLAVVPDAVHIAQPKKSSRFRLAVAALWKIIA